VAKRKTPKVEPTFSPEGLAAMKEAYADLAPDLAKAAAAQDDADFADFEQRLEEMHTNVERLLTVCERLQKKLSLLEQSHTSYHPSFGKDNCHRCGGIISLPTTPTCPKCGGQWRA
jgi:hypothetical protein